MIGCDCFVCSPVVGMTYHETADVLGHNHIVIQSDSINATRGLEHVGDRYRHRVVCIPNCRCPFQTNIDSAAVLCLGRCAFQNCIDNAAVLCLGYPTSWKRSKEHIHHVANSARVY